jgi:hypothetical protein
MGAAALAARLPLPFRARPEATASCGLAFDRPGGPLVAVCGLVGGSGASTLAFSLARQAARDSALPVLLSEADSSGAGLALVAGHAGPLCLSDLAARLADGEPPARSFTELEPRLRLVASAPRTALEAAPDAVRALLRDARAAHGLVVVDCGSAWGSTRAVLDEASHVIWTLPATAPAVARARVLFAGESLPAPGRWRELLVATAMERRAGAKVRTLRRLAANRCERLVLAPYVEALARGQQAADDERLRAPLTALAATLGRSR